MLSSLMERSIDFLFFALLRSKEMNLSVHRHQLCERGTVTGRLTCYIATLCTTMFLLGQTRRSSRKQDRCTFASPLNPFVIIAIEFTGISGRGILRRIMSGDALQQSFETAAEYARTCLPSSLSTANKSKLYGLFKQATEGSVKGERPGIFAPTARAKYDAWKEQDSLDKETAMKEYVAFVDSLKE